MSRTKWIVAAVAATALALGAAAIAGAFGGGDEEPVTGRAAQ